MGKIKTYKANTNVSINVVLSNTKNLHISFSPLSNGTSTFTTDNEEVMNAIERHYKFGKMFRLHSVQSKSDTANTDKEPNPTPSTDEHVDKTGAEEPALKKVKVSDLAAAKDYLADTFDISRTLLRSMKEITEQAASKGIEFEGLE